MTKDQLAQSITAHQWQRLMCPCCGADDSLTARESAFYPLALPREAGDLRLDIQMVCQACHNLVRLRVYEQVDKRIIQVAPDDPHGDAEDAKIGREHICQILAKRGFEGMMWGIWKHLGQKEVGR